MNEALNLVGGCGHIFMLPNHDERPSGSRERAFVAAVALDVALQFRQPVIEIRLGQYGVVGTQMPEAPAALDRNSSAREHDVGSVAEAGDDGRVFAKSETATVQLAAQCNLGLGVLGAIPAHDRARFRR